jgi:hypothetical protein
MMILRKYWKGISLVIGLVILYRDVFLSRFFQDDFILLNIAKTRGLLEPIPNFPYRPLAIQFFYSISPDPFILHSLMFLFFLGGLYFVYKLTKDWFVVYLIAFNISLFPLFYWVATSYFSLAFFFVFAALYFNSLILFILGLLSNELVVVFPFIFLLWSWFKNKIEIKKLLPFFAVSAIYLPLRIFLIPFPQVDDYKLDFSLKFFSTARWYFLRIFNLPEGIRNNNLLLVLFVLLVILVLLNLKHLNLKLLVFGFLWFFIGALPFFFLPGHMSAYYLTISLFGPILFLSKTIKKFRYLFLVIYLLMAYFGLEFLKISHWIILKP